MSNLNLGRVAVVAALIAFLTIPSLAWGSGSYSGRPSHPPSSIDRASYERGKSVFAGQFSRRDARADANSQAEVLEELQLKLPLKARSGVTLTAYAGQLDEEQIAALRYFLKKRYKVE